MEAGGGSTGGAVPQDEKTQAMLVWLLSIFIGFISPLIFMFTAKDKAFVYRNAMLCLTQAILVIAVVIACWVIGILLAMIAGPLALLVMFIYLAAIIGSLVLTIMNLIKALNGESWDPPVVAGVCKSWFKV